MGNQHYKLKTTSLVSFQPWAHLFSPTQRTGRRCSEEGDSGWSGLASWVLPSPAEPNTARNPCQTLQGEGELFVTVYKFSVARNLYKLICKIAVFFRDTNNRCCICFLPTFFVRLNQLWNRKEVIAWTTEMLSWYIVSAYNVHCQYTS